VDVDEWLRLYDHVYRTQAEGRTHLLFTDTFEETEWGWALELRYDLAFERFVAGPAAGLWRFDGENVISYGLHLGARL
jgi:hypothetical protein